MKDGQRCGQSYSLQEKKAYYQHNLNCLSQSERRLINPHFYKVDISEELLQEKMHIIERLVKEIEDFSI